MSLHAGERAWSTGTGSADLQGGLAGAVDAAGARVLVTPGRRWSAPLVPTVLLAILLVALALRLLGIAYDYPYLLEVDETRVLNVTLRMMAAHSLDPHFYQYGPFLIYIEALWLTPYLAVRALLGHPGVPAVTIYGSGMATTSDPFMHVYARLPFAALGASTVWLAYLVARRLAGPAAGLLAALLLALSPLHIYQSLLVLPNAPTSFFALLATWLTLRDLQRLPNSPTTATRRAGWAWARGLRARWDRLWQGVPLALYLAVGAAALGAAIKYNAVVILLIPILAVYLEQRGDSGRAWLRSCFRLCVAAAAIFLIVTPPAIFNPIAFLHGAGYELKHYAVIGGGGGTQGGPSIIWYGQYLIEQEGLLVFPVAVFGLSILVWRYRRRIDLLLLVTIAAYYLLIGVQKVHFARNLLVVLPLISVAAGYVLVRMAVWRRPVGLIMSTMLAALMILSLADGSLAQARGLLARPGPLVVRSWLQSHLPPRAHLVADGYTTPPLDRRDVTITYIDNVRLTPAQLWQMDVGFVALSKSLWYYLDTPSHLSSKSALMVPVYSTGGIAVFAIIHHGV